MEEIKTVSSGDLPPDFPSLLASVSDGDAVTLNDIYAMQEEIFVLLQKESIWEKPINDYTPTEGILLLIFILLLWLVIKQFIGGIFK